jgi:hypothetical protein
MNLDIDTTLTTLVFLGALTPFITAILTKLRDPDWFKGLVSMTLAVGAGVLASLQASDGEIVLQEVLHNGFGVWLVHLMTYFGVSKDAVDSLSRATVKFAPIAMKRASKVSL